MKLQGIHHFLFFQVSLKKLAEAGSKSQTEKDKAYVKFFNSYGTHYITGGIFGATLLVQTSFTKDSVTKESMDTESKCR